MSDNAPTNDGAASTAAETQQPATQTPAPAQRQPRSREGGQQRDDRPPRVERHRDDRVYDDRRPRSLHDDFNRQQPTWWERNGMTAIWAVVLIVLAGLLFKGWTDTQDRKQALALAGVTQVEKPDPAAVTPPAPAPGSVPQPSTPATISQEEANRLFNRQVGSGPAMQPPGTKMLVVSLDRVDDATYGTIYVPNKATGQAITADSPNSPPPPFDLRCPDPTNGQLEAFVTSERARSGRYYVMFRARR